MIGNVPSGPGAPPSGPGARPGGPGARPTRRVALLYDEIPHHGRRSGYRSIARYLEELGGCEIVEPLWVTRHSHSAIDRLVRPRGVGWYRLESLGRELSAVRRLVRRPAWTCHFLGGEGAYHYAGRIGGVLGGFAGRTVCTFHQPPSVFDRVIGDATPVELLDAAVVLCSEQAAHLRTRMEPSRIHLIPHFVDATFFRPATDDGTLELTSRGFVCAGSWLRDYRTLAAVARLVYEEDPRISITVVSPGVDAQALSRIPNVRVLPRVSDEQLLALYQGAAALLLPLSAATANNSLMEAMACGLPVIVTDVGGVSEYVAPAGAILVAPGNAAEMCQAVLRLAGDPGLRATLGAHGRDRALELSPWATAGALLALYDELAGER